MPARTSVIVDNRASATATVVEVRAPDRIGTLYRITQALADLDLDIRLAKVADGDRSREIERAVLVKLSRA